MKPEHAVVVGGSVAGLLAAGAAAKHFQRVTILERDELVDGPVTRKGAPQGNQIHILLPIGEKIVEDLFPGIRRELIEEGCGEYNHIADIPSLTSFGWNLRVKLPALDVIAFRRPLLEWVIRRRLLGLDNVEIRQATVTGLTIDDGSKITGAAVKDGEPVIGDLVIDAAGRGTKAPKWMIELGFEAPKEAEVRVYIGYATQFVRLRDDQFAPGTRGIGTFPQPDQPLGGVILPSDNGVFAVAAFGMMKRYPPGDRDGMVEYLTGAPSPLLSGIVRDSEPVSEIHTYRMPGNLRRHWEDLDSRPGRFVVTGDAVASFNPIYGQGLTMAAFGAKYLDEALSADGATLDTAPAEFQRALAAKVDVAFLISARGDIAYDGVELINYEPPSDEEMEYLGRLWELSVAGDTEVAEALAEATFTLRPEILETEELRRKAEATPAPELPSFDPCDYPTYVYPERAPVAPR